MSPQPLLPAPAPALPWCTAPLPAEAVAIAVVIPAHGQPGLLPEAIEAALGQQGAPPLAVVVVDDGCPYPETWRTAAAYAAAHPGRVHALRRRNGGLSAARNTGIDFALAAFPRLEAVYFLDADNRLHPAFLARAHAALTAAPATVGWVYPDFDMFGEQRNYSVAGEFALLPLLFANFCEAGSLVRRGLLDAGLRFDEMLKSGFEDWDFWLQAVRLGYRGQHLPLSGFRYRRRPESMLREAERRRDILVEQLRQKHRPLFAPRHLAALEARERPRWVIHLADQGSVALRHDPAEAEGGELPAEALRQRQIAALETPKAVYVPELVCFAESGALALLRRFGLAQGVFWHAELLLREHDLVALELRSGDRAALAVEPGGDAAGRVAQAPILFVPQKAMTDHARDPQEGWPESLADASPRKAALLRVVLPHGVLAAPLASVAPLRQFIHEGGALAAALAGRSRLPRDWRGDFRYVAATIPRRLRRSFGIGASLPRRPIPGGREIGFVMPIFSFAGTEKVVQNQARIFRDRGWRTHLVVAGARSVELGSGTREAFDSITAFAGFGESGLDWKRGYLGIGLSALPLSKRMPDVLGLLAGLDVVLNTHAAGMHAVMAQLRRLGTRTYAGLHVTEISRWGQPMGNPHMALPYEHAYDGFTVISDQLRDWCISQGIPAGKLHLVRNAPAFPVPPARLAEVLAGRRRRGGRLRVLSLGRLDTQKGVDRLAVMAERTAEAMDWRIIGKAVLADQALPTLPVPLEPPAVTTEQLDALYAWADVVVLPSRYEGVPLTVLEAQRMGCVAIATEVGAVGEIIADGVDGFLIGHERPEAAIIEDFVALLGRLAADRALLRGIGETAAARLAAADWEQNMAGFLAHLDRLLPPEAIR